MQQNGCKVQSGLRLQTTSQPVTSAVDADILIERFITIVRMIPPHHHCKRLLLSLMPDDVLLAGA